MSNAGCGCKFVFVSNYSTAHSISAPPFIFAPQRGASQILKAGPDLFWRMAWHVSTAAQDHVVYGMQHQQVFDDFRREPLTRFAGVDEEAREVNRARFGRPYRR